MVIKTSDTDSIKKILKKIFIPGNLSHKGQNGRVMIIGGSKLFHAASIWAAEIASHFVDIVHYSSIQENNEVMLSLKKQFTNGIIIPLSQLDHYMEEDDAVLIGPGMMRSDAVTRDRKITEINDLLAINDPGEFTYYMTKYLINRYPGANYVFDAGSLQMMNKDWLKTLKKKPVITPHQLEFEKLFNYKISDKSLVDKEKAVKLMAKEYNCVILLKAIVDIVSDGENTIIIEGGNQGLTKGGTGDVLAGLVVSFLSKSQAFESAVFASILLKKTADLLMNEYKYWYNIKNIIDHVPKSMTILVNNV